MITEDKVTEIFCIADDFCKVFDAQMAKYTFKAERKRKYHRESRMSKAEIMVIMILFHSSGYRCLKHFYLEKVCKHMRHLFPEVVSYNRWSSESRSQTCLDYAKSRQRKTIVNRFVELEREIAIPLIVFIKKVLLARVHWQASFRKALCGWHTTYNETEEQHEGSIDVRIRQTASQEEGYH